MNRATPYLTVSRATLVAFFAFAGATATADQPSAKVDPCTLVTKAEAEAVLGVSIVAPSASDDGLFRHCVYASADKRHYLYFDARDEEQGNFQRAMKVNRHGLPVDPSMGADAYTDRSSGTLLVWRKGVALNILVGDQSGNQSDAKRLEAQEKIAKTALARL
jgi:hypothetical protein